MIDYALEYLKLPPEQASLYLDRFRDAIGTAHTLPSTDRTLLPAVFEFAADNLPVVDQSSASRASENAMG
jgi:hypothetical protein